MGVKKTTACPPEMVLEGFHDERLDDERRRQVGGHLEDCDSCSRKLDALSRVSELLRQAASMPAPEIDMSRVARRLFAGRRRDRRWLRPLLAAGLAAVLLAALVLWPRNRPSLPSPAVTLSPVPAATPGLSEPVLVEKMSGQVQGPDWQEQRLVVPLARQVELEDGALLSVWLNRRCQVVLRGPATASFLVGDNSTLVELARGRLLARLRGPLAVPFVVATPAGRVRATGTSFSVESMDRDVTRVEMGTGSVSLEPARAAAVPLRAPGCARMSRQGQAACACTGLVGEMLRQAGGGEQFSEGHRPGWLRVDSDITGAMVEVDGRAQGRAPLTVALLPGPVEVTVRSGTMHNGGQVEILAGQLLRRSFALLGEAGSDTGEASGPARPGPDGSAAGQPRPGANVERIRHLLARREYRQADRLLERLLQEHPADLRALMLLGDSHRLQGRGRQALDVYGQVASRATDVHLAEAALFQQGLLLLGKLGRPGQARDVFTHLLERFPAGLLREDAHYRLVECQLLLGDYQGALRASRSYLQQYPQGLKSRELRHVIEQLQEKGNEEQ